jgi:hypothetical protein
MRHMRFIYLARRLTHVGDTALRLAHFFGRSLEFWLNLPNLYGFSCFLLSDPQLAYTHVCNPSGNCKESLPTDFTGHFPPPS